MKLRWLTTPLVIAVLIASHLVPATPANAAPKCNDLFQPVCAVTKAGKVQTFSNACFAKAGGATVISQGSCPVFCPDIYEPVCGRKDGVNMTYANSCTATAAGAVVLAPGKCPGRICSQVYRPVCGVDSNGKLTTYPNACIAINRGVRILHNGKC